MQNAAFGLGTHRPTTNGPCRSERGVQETASVHLQGWEVIFLCVGFIVPSKDRVTSMIQSRGSARTHAFRVQELCVKVEVAVLGSPSLKYLMVSVNVKGCP